MIIIIEELSIIALAFQVILWASIFIFNVLCFLHATTIKPLSPKKNPFSHHCSILYSL